MTAPDWSEAACIGHNPELFFPAKTVRNRHAWDEPRAICQPCPIRDACLTWALETGQADGMWGGMDERQRAALRKSQPKPRPIKHGTPGDHRAHLSRGESSCTACWAAAKAENTRQNAKAAERRAQRRKEAS